jgi:hypothetical protein
VRCGSTSRGVRSARAPAPLGRPPPFLPVCGARVGGQHEVPVERPHGLRLGLAEQDAPGGPDRLDHARPVHARVRVPVRVPAERLGLPLRAEHRIGAPAGAASIAASRPWSGRGARRPRPRPRCCVAFTCGAGLRARPAVGRPMRRSAAPVQPGEVPSPRPHLAGRAVHRLPDPLEQAGVGRRRAALPGRGARGGLSGPGPLLPRVGREPDPRGHLAPPGRPLTRGGDVPLQGRAAAAPGGPAGRADGRIAEGGRGRRDPCPGTVRSRPAPRRTGDAEAPSRFRPMGPPPPGSCGPQYRGPTPGVRPASTRPAARGRP